MPKLDIATGTNKVAAEIARIIGGDNVRRLELTIDVNEAVTAKIERYVSVKELREIVELLRDTDGARLLDVSSVGDEFRNQLRG